MTAETNPEQPPAQTETEQLRDSVSALQTIVNRVREAVGTDEPAPIRESYRIRVLETRVSDAEYERNLAQERAEAASRVGTRHMARAERAEGALARTRRIAEEWHARAGENPETAQVWTSAANAVLASTSTELRAERPSPFESSARAADEAASTARVLSALHRSAEDTVTRVIDLHEQWVAAGPPPLGASLARWWDARLVELHDAIQPADQTTEK
ncbi:hypothetical protein ACIQHU_01180 [Streptomyces tendae]|uniref:hypothetical protein n=1 Tax=Streptomyces tendae TaxID=1932 RepID=UPI0037F57D8A